MNAATNEQLDAQLARAVIDARSFVGESEVMPAFFNAIFEDYMTKALQSGPGPIREAWMERAAGIRYMVDTLNERETRQVQMPTF